MHYFRLIDDSGPAFAVLLALLLGTTACTDNETSYFPLDKGRRWQYEIETNTVEGTRKQKDVVQSMGRVNNGVANLYRFRSASGQESMVLSTGEEVGLVNQIEPQMNLHTIFLKHPVEAEASWESVITTSTIATFDRKAGNFIEDVPVTARVESIDETVIVPAGRFHHCLKITATGEKLIPKGTYAYQEKMDLKIVNTRWYAPGIGLIREEHEEITGVLEYPDSGYVKVLDKFSAP